MKRPTLFALAVLLLALAGWALVDRRRGGTPGRHACPICPTGLVSAPQAASGPSSARASSQPPGASRPVDSRFGRALLRTFDGQTDRMLMACESVALAPLRPATESFDIVWRQAVARQFTDPAAYIAAGERAMAREEFRTALECFGAARGLEPNNLDAARGRAVALTALDLPEEAEPAYRDLLRLVPGDRTTRYNLAVTLMKLGRNSEAQELLAQLVRDDANFLPAWYNLGTIYTAGGKLSLAREAWGKAAALAPKLAYPCMKLGEVLMDLEEPNEAILAFAEAARRDPNDPAAHMNMAAASVRIGSFGMAVLATERAAKLAPTDAGVWASLGNLRVAVYAATRERRFLREAVEAWDRSLAVDPNQADVKDSVEHFRRELHGAASSKTGSGD